MKQLPVRKLLIICFWLALWQAVSAAVHSPIIFVGPLEMARALASQVFAPDFWITTGNSAWKISAGFLLAFLTAVAAGGVSCFCPFFKDLLEPVILLMKSVPVASFVILALIWAGSGNLSVFISFLIVFPMVYTSTVAGLLSTDKKLLEMAKVFRVAFFKKIRYIYWPSLFPYLAGCLKTAVGMSWKSGVAAEVIGVPAHSVGEKLYMAKIYLDTADLFAWTFVLILASALLEKVFLFFFGKLEKW